MPFDHTATLAERYRADGFGLITESVFPAELVQRASDGMDMIRRGEYDTGEEPCGGKWAPGDDDNVLCKVEVPQKANLAIRELVSSPALGKLVAETVDAEMVQVWWTQLLYKPPVAGDPTNTVIGWHQDRGYWLTWEKGDGLLTAWIALSDVTEASGPMKFVRGSHNWDLFEGDFYGQNNEEIRATFNLPEGAQWEEVPAILPPGGISLHSCMTLHGSEHNYSDQPRRSLAIHLRTEKSIPKPGIDRECGLTQYLENMELNPVIYGELQSL